jgi:hypothetical protein
MTDLWEWMERPKWYRRSVPPKSEEEMTPEERTEWVKSLKRSHDESVRPTREEE